jgi:N-acetylneuraminic acid mutarotase
MLKRVWLLGLLGTGLVACATRQTAAPHWPSALPQPVSNHAVAMLVLDGQPHIYSFNGLLSGKTHRDISNQAHVWRGGRWHRLETPADQPPVLASVAVTVGESVYLFGGYTVAADHSEVSVPNVWRINGRTDQWQAMPAMPTPVDDTVALVYRDRYIYLISGWHDVDNVNLVQVFDTATQTWQQATPFPLPAVFGHAGGLSGQQLLICDGVKVLWQGDKKSFKLSPACALGRISEADHTVIDWQPVPHHSGVAQYRMAATDDGGQQLVFAGGSDNPYNYDGVGYDGQPSLPSADVRVFDLQQGSWEITSQLIKPTMDHRSLLRFGRHYLIAGGMGPNQQVLAAISLFHLD